MSRWANSKAQIKKKKEECGNKKINIFYIIKYMH